MCLLCSFVLFVLLLHSFTLQRVFCFDASQHTLVVTFMCLVAGHGGGPMSRFPIGAPHVSLMLPPPSTRKSHVVAGAPVHRRRSSIAPSADHDAALGLLLASARGHTTDSMRADGSQGTQDSPVLGSTAALVVGSIEPAAATPAAAPALPNNTPSPSRLSQHSPVSRASDAGGACSPLASTRRGAKRAPLSPVSLTDSDRIEQPEYSARFFEESPSRLVQNRRRARATEAVVRATGYCSRVERGLALKRPTSEWTDAATCAPTCRVDIDADTLGTQPLRGSVQPVKAMPCFLGLSLALEMVSSMRIHWGQGKQPFGGWVLALPTFLHSVCSSDHGVEHID